MEGQAKKEDNKRAGPQQTRPVLFLRLRDEENALVPRRHITWDSGVKEVKGRSSKRCCVFHKKRLFGESSSEDDSSSASDSEGLRHRGCGHEGQQNCEHHETQPSQDGAPQPSKPERKHRPRCTKEACYCHTRFA